MINEPQKIMGFYEKLVSSPIHNFPPVGKISVSPHHGVYIIYSPFDDVLHVGMTPYGKGGLNQRLYNHISRGSVFYEKYLKPKSISLRDNYRFRFIEVSNPRERALLEALTAGLLCPAHFGTGGKELHT